jgi:hypothetical protein
LYDYCVKVGVSEQALRNWREKLHARGFDTGPAWLKAQNVGTSVGKIGEELEDNEDRR